MSKLIEKYDDNEDGVLEWSEFEHLMTDEVFALDESSLLNHAKRKSQMSEQGP